MYAPGSGNYRDPSGISFVPAGALQKGRAMRFPLKTIDELQTELVTAVMNKDLALAAMLQLVSSIGESEKTSLRIYR